MTVRQIVCLVSLSLWLSTAWVTDQFIPSPASPVVGRGLHLVLIALLCIPLALRRSESEARGEMSRYCLAAAVSLGLIAIPYLLLNLARGRIASTTGVLVFALLPMVLLVYSGGSEANTAPIGQLLPYGMLGVGGVLILLPVAMPRSVSGLLGLSGLVAAMILTAICSVWLHRLLGGLSLRVALPAICVVNGLVLLLAGGLTALFDMDRSTLAVESARGLLIDLPETFLLLWLLKTISPLQLSTLYWIAPLFTVLEGLVIFRPRFEARTLIGIALLSVGAWLMLNARPGDADTGLKLNYDR